MSSPQHADERRATAQMASDMVVLEKERSARRVCSDCTGHVQVMPDASSYTERRNIIFSNRGGITQMISPESSLVHYNNGRSNGKHREVSTLGNDVRGRPGAVCYDS